MIELNFPNPVREETDFYGRRAVLDRIEQVFRSGTRRPVAVYGERRMGKTSLMNVVAARLQALPSPCFVPLFPATVGVYSLQDFAREALQSLCEYRDTSLTERGLLGRDGQFQLVSAGQFFGETRALLQGAPAVLHLLCIDEFDALLHNCSVYGQAVEAIKILDLCHELVTQTDLPLTFFLTLTRLPDDIRDSFNTLVTEEAERVDLRPFSSQEIEQLLDGILGRQVMFGPAQRRHLEHLSGGHPYLLKLLLANWLDHASFQELPLRATTASLERAADDAARDPRAEHALGNLLRVHFDRQERDLVDLMAGLGDRIATTQLDRAGREWRTVAENLIRRGYLVRREADSVYAFRAALLGRWLHQRPAFEERLYHLADLHRRVTEGTEDKAGAGSKSGARAQAGPETEIQIDAAQRRLLLQGQEIRLTPQEYQILSFLCRRTGRLVTKDAVAQHLWPELEGEVYDSAIDATIYRLRRKLGDDARQPRYLETVVGHGFILHRASFCQTDELSKERS